MFVCEYCDGAEKDGLIIEIPEKNPDDEDNVPAGHVVPKYDTTGMSDAEKILYAEKYTNVGGYAYLDYTAATGTTAGREHYECAECGADIDNNTDVLEKVEFSAEIVEGDYTFGSLVEVIVSIDGVNQAIDGLEFEVVANNMVFVGYEAVSVENGTIVADRNANGNVQVYGWFKNNVEINAESQLVKLMFRVMVNDNAEDALSVYVKNDGLVEYTDEEGETQSVSYGTAAASTADVRMLLDVNGKDGITFRDLAMLAEMIENGEYDVVCDINYNGVIDLQDMVEARQLYVGNVEDYELAAKYLPLADAKVMFPEDYCTTHNAFFCDDASHNPI
jgi:hypothetical protein